MYIHTLPHNRYNLKCELTGKIYQVYFVILNSSIRGAVNEQVILYRNFIPGFCILCGGDFDAEASPSGRGLFEIKQAHGNLNYGIEPARYTYKREAIRTDQHH